MVKEREELLARAGKTKTPQSVPERLFWGDSMLKDDIIIQLGFHF